MEGEESKKSMSMSKSGEAPAKQSQAVKPDAAGSESKEAGVAAKPSPALDALSSRPSDADAVADVAHLPSYSSMYHLNLIVNLLFLQNK